jgi:hypothetical protein
MTMTVHCKRESFDVYIGRPSKWGNPFSTGNREEVIQKYEQCLIIHIQGSMDMTTTALKKARLKLSQYRDMGIKITVENNLIVKANNED